MLKKKTNNEEQPHDQSQYLTTGKLGRLKSFGLTKPWQIALLLPNGWDDLTQVSEDFRRLKVGPCVVAGQLNGYPETRWDGTPRLVGSLLDKNGCKLGFSAFGDTRDFKQQLMENSHQVILFGQLEEFNNRFWLKSPEIVTKEWLGRYRPRYPGKTGILTPDKVRHRVVGGLQDAVPYAANFLASELSEFGTRRELAEMIGFPGWTIEAIIHQAHTPVDTPTGERAQRAMEYLAALGIIKEARGSHGARPTTTPLHLGDWRKRIAQIPFTLTDEQEQAIKDSVADLTSHTPMHRILAGDVGLGKSCVYGTIAAAVVDGGGTVAILVPNATLAEQVAREFKEWWPDLPLQLITGGETGVKIRAPFLIGTTALLFRNLGNPNLMIVDEQQKMSIDQREQLVGPDTHFLEVTATCIPRTQALLRYGVVKMSRLTKSHTPKKIRTHIWQRHEWPALFEKVKESIAKGNQVMLVYPLREKSPEEEPPCEDEQDESGETQGKAAVPQAKKQALRSAAEIYEKWNTLYPGQVRWAHGQMTDDEKLAALRDMREGKAKILVATTLVETGLNLPFLRHGIVVHPERHGLTTLHQLRGRLARLGGDGWFDLFLPYPVKEHTMERLQVLVKTQNGFEVAEHDMRLRGVGDLSKQSCKQSGADETYFFGRPVKIDILDEAIKMLEGDLNGR